MSDELDEIDFEMDGGGVAAVECDGLTSPAELVVATAAPVRRPAPTTRPRRGGLGPELYFDIETVPDLERYASFELDPLPQARPRTPLAACPPNVVEILGGTLPGIEAFVKQLNPCMEWLAQLAGAESVGKNRAGIAKLIAEAQAADNTLVAAIDERNKLLSTTPEYCKVAALGWAVGDEEPQSMVLGHNADELQMIDQFWSLVARHKPIVGFNCLEFDLPVLFIRSALMGLAASRTLDMKPWGGDVLDLLRVRFPGGWAKKGMGLKGLLRLYGIPVRCPDVDGSQVGELLVTDPAKVGLYVESDAVGARDLRRFYAGFFCP